MNALMTATLLPLLGLICKVTLLPLIAWSICRLLTRSSASTRHLVWAASLGGVLLLPILSMSLPQWDIAVRQTAPSRTIITAVPANGPLHQTGVLQLVPVPGPISAPTSNPLSASPTHSIRSEPSETNRPYPVALICSIALFTIWAVGFIIVLGQFLFGLGQISRIRRQATDLDSAIAEEAQQRLRVQHVQFVQATEQSSITVPVTWGIFRPTVLLPQQSMSWSDTCLRAALLHELAHVQRRDWAAQIIARLACAVYWWHPLVWWTARQAREAGETACDDLVLGTGMKPFDYAQQLIEVVRSMPGSAPSRTVAITMAQPSEVEGRIKIVLSSNRNRKPVNRKMIIAAALTLGIALVPLAPMRLVAKTTAHAEPEVVSQRKTRSPRGILVFRYLRDVRSSSFPSRGSIRMDDYGIDAYSFFDTTTGKTFRGIAQIKIDFSKLTALGSAPRPGTTRYHIPSELRIRSDQGTAYFTHEQQRQASSLVSELARWQGFLHDSPVIVTDADIEHATAHLGGARQTEPSLATTFNAKGTQLFRDFTTTHIHEVLGIFIDGNLVSAPMIVEPITDGEGELSGNFRSLAEAQKLADRLNKPGPEGIIPSDRLLGFRKAVEVNPNDADAQYILGETLSRLSLERVGSTYKMRVVSPQLLDEAIVHMQKAVDLRPNNASWQAELATELQDRGRYAEVISMYQRVLEQMGPPESMPPPQHRTAVQLEKANHRRSAQLMLAYTFMGTHQFPQALLQFQDALRDNPDENWILLGYGDVLNKVGRTIEARAAWQKVITVYGINSDYGRQAQKNWQNTLT